MAEYPDIVKTALNYDDELVLICGMALGYEDTDARINSYRTDREHFANFTRFYD